MKKVRSKLYPTKIGVIKTFSLSPDDEIGEIAVECSGCTYYYSNLAELCEKWEDYEEPKTYYYISDFGTIREGDVGKFVDYEMLRKEIGNYFETKEEAEKAVERLETWRQLKDRRLFRFDGYDVAHKSNGNLAGQIFYDAGNYCIGDVEKYLDLLFGGENE